MFTKNFKNMLAGFGMSYLHYSNSGIALKTRAGAKRYLSMANNTAYYYMPCMLTCGTSFTSGASSNQTYTPIHLDWACTAYGDGNTHGSKAGLIFSDSNGVTEDSYILPGTEFFPLSKFSMTIKSRSMTAKEDDVTYKVVYTLTSKVSTDTVIGSLGYYCVTTVCTAQGSTGTSGGQFLMIAIDLEEPITIPANSAADLTVTIKANGQAWAEIV